MQQEVQLQIQPADGRAAGVFCQNGVPDRALWVLGEQRNSQNNTEATLQLR